MGRNTPQTMTEVNMNVATYLKFDGISNVLVNPAAVQPTARFPQLPAAEGGAAAGEAPARETNQLGTGLSPKSRPLDTSFNVHMTLGNALEQLSQQQTGQQTPALGKCSLVFSVLQMEETNLYHTSPFKFASFAREISCLALVTVS